jgi:uncharacterized protein (DUF4415 family)
LDFADLDETFFDDALFLPSYDRLARHWRNDSGCRLGGVRHLGHGSRQRHQHAPGQQIRKGSFMPTAKKKGYSAKKDWDDVQSPELTDEQMAKAKPFAEVFPELAASIRRGRGPNKAPTKKLVSLRLSGQVIEAYKAKGPGWQSRIDADLRRINKIK